MQTSHWSARVPFYYGWVVVAIAFVTMAVGVNARTAFSLLYPAILDEYGWDSGATAGIFAFGFLASMLVTPFIGLLVERYGPNRVIPVGALVVASGLALTPFVSSLWGLYCTLGAMVVGGSVAVSYIGHSAFLPNWFVRRRGLVIGIAFSGVGVGGIVLFPLLQSYIGSVGWREACVGLAILIIIAIVPINLFAQRRRPEDIGLNPDGVSTANLAASAEASNSIIVDTKWAETDWTYKRVVREPRFWALALAFFFSLFNHYAVQVHQTRYFIELGFGVERSAWALGLMVFLGIPGQIIAGHLSDRIGREWSWALAMSGYLICFLTFLAMREQPSLTLMYTAVAAVGLLGAGTAPLFGTIGAELFGGPSFGRVFGLLGAACSVGAATGAWLTGYLYDHTGNYDSAFIIGSIFTVLSALCVAIAAPGRVRPVPGRQAKPRPASVNSD
jgi:MFS family permease